MHAACYGVEALDFLRRWGSLPTPPVPTSCFSISTCRARTGREVLAEIKVTADLSRIRSSCCDIASRARSRQSYDLHANCYLTKPSSSRASSTVIGHIRNFWLSAVTCLRDYMIS